MNRFANVCACDHVRLDFELPAPSLAKALTWVSSVIPMMATTEKTDKYILFFMSMFPLLYHIAYL